MLIFGFVELTVILSHTPYIYTYMYFVALMQSRTLYILGPSMFFQLNTMNFLAK